VWYISILPSLRSAEGGNIIPEAPSAKQDKFYPV
jgi:hypothetical protein